MLIVIDSSPCSLSLRNRSTLCSTTKCHQNKSDLKNVFVQKSFFSISSVLSIPIMLIGINGGYFPAICRACLQFCGFEAFFFEKYDKKWRKLKLFFLFFFWSFSFFFTFFRRISRPIMTCLLSCEHLDALLVEGIFFFGFLYFCNI